MKKTKILFASLALCGFMGLAYAASDAVTSPDAPETPGAAGSEEKVGTITDEITASTIGEPSANWKYVTHEDVKGVSDGAYTFQCGLPKVGEDELILFRAANMNSGFITSTQGGDAKEITVEFADASVVPGVIDPAEAPVLKVFGSHTPYAAVTDLFYPTTWGDELGEISEAEPTYTIDGSYEYIGVRVADAYTVAVSSIKVTLEGPQYYVAAPDFINPNDKSVYPGVAEIPTPSVITCETEDAVIYWSESEDGPWDVYDEEEFNPMNEITYYAYATTHEGECKSEVAELVYQYKQIDNLIDAAAVEPGLPYKYVGDLVVVSADGMIIPDYPGAPENPGYKAIVWDGKNFGLFTEKDEDIYKGNYIRTGWIAETLADGSIAAYGCVEIEEDPEEPEEPEAPAEPVWVAPASTVAANTTLVDNDVIKATTEYEANVGNQKGTLNDVEYDHTMNVRIDKAPTADFPHGTNKAGSTPIVLTVKKAADVTFFFRRQADNNDGKYTAGAGKDIQLYGSDLKQIKTGVIEVVEETEENKYANCTETFSLEPGTYTVAARGTTLNLFAIFVEEAVAAKAPAADDAEETTEPVVIKPEGKVAVDGWAEYVPGFVKETPAAAYNGTPAANYYCVINDVTFAKDTPAKGETAEATVGEAKTKITVKNMFVGTAPVAGTYNVTGMWVAAGEKFVFVPVHYAAVTEEFDLTELTGNYEFMSWSFLSVNKDDMVDKDLFASKQVAIRPTENPNEVTINGLVPGYEIELTGVVEYYTYQIPEMEGDDVVRDEDGEIVMIDKLSNNGKITVEACDIMIDGVKYRFSSSNSQYEEAIFDINAGTFINASFAISQYLEDDRAWDVYVKENAYLSKYIAGDLYLFGTMNGWGTDTEENEAWKFSSYDGVTYTLVIPAAIPADKMFIFTDGVYGQKDDQGNEIAIKSWGGQNNMDLNDDYTVWIQNPYYVSHCNLSEELPAGSIVTFVFSTDKTGAPVYNEATVRFSKGGTTAIEAIDTEAGDAVYYNINGVKVENPAQGGVYIRVINGKATKVYVK